MRVVERHKKLLAAKAVERGEAPPAAPQGAAGEQSVPLEFYAYMALAMTVVFGVSAGIAVLVMKYST